MNNTDQHLEQIDLRCPSCGYDLQELFKENEGNENLRLRCPNCNRIILKDKLLADNQGMA